MFEEEAEGVVVSSTAQQIAQTIETDRHRQVTITDIRPPASDGRGMSSFYLVSGWIVGGYMAATILGMAGGARPANRHRTVIRLGSLALYLYAIASGLGGAVVAGPLLGALEGHFAELWALGALIVFASAATTVGFQVLWGVIGIGVTILRSCCRRSGGRSASGSRRARAPPPYATRSTSPATPSPSPCGCSAATRPWAPPRRSPRPPCASAAISVSPTRNRTAWEQIFE